MNYKLLTAAVKPRFSSVLLELIPELWQTRVPGSLDCLVFFLYFWFTLQAWTCLSCKIPSSCKYCMPVDPTKPVHKHTIQIWCASILVGQHTVLTVTSTVCSFITTVVTAIFWRHNVHVAALLSLAADLFWLDPQQHLFVSLSQQKQKSKLLFCLCQLQPSLAMQILLSCG